MKIICNLLVAILLLCSAAEVQANGSAPGVTITKVEPYAYGTLFYVWLSANISGSPACATAYNVFVMDSTTPGGKTLVSTLQMAWAGGRSVDLAGDGTCGTPGANNVETLYSVFAH